MAFKKLETKEKARLCGLVMGCLAFLQFSSTLNDASQHTQFTVDRREESAMRTLAKAIGEDGDCEWSPPARVDPGSPLFKTLVAGYPGSGKRLTWLMIEALTNKVVGDDFDLSLHGNHVVALKTSYPHPEAYWSWGDKMDQAIMVIRNPRWAIQSYLTLKDEIDYSTSWEQSFNMRQYVYTNRPPVPTWEAWRDASFPYEIERWGGLIDFYMSNGVEDTPDYTGPSEHCGGDDLADCTPKEIISFEKLYDQDTGPAEMAKLATVLDGENVEMVNSTIWDCVYNVTWYHPISRYNNDRDGPAPETRFFTKDQLIVLQTEMQRIFDKYSAEPFLTGPLAVQAATLVGHVNEYIVEVQAEIDTM